MKKWHIAALVIVGLIVAGIAYTMYEKKNALRRDPMWRHAQRQLLSEGTPGTNSGIPGFGNKIEDDRPAGPGIVRKWPESGPGYGTDALGRQVYGPTRKRLEEGLERKRDGEFWDAFQNWL